MSRNDMRCTRVPMLGRRFGKLVVAADMGPAPMGTSPKWRCVCDCGNQNAVFTGRALRCHGKTDCGCQTKRRRAPGETRPKLAREVAEAEAVFWAMARAQRQGVTA